eukprot:2447789-Rhodomonas_salina.2
MQCLADIRNRSDGHRTASCVCSIWHLRNLLDLARNQRGAAQTSEPNTSCVSIRYLTVASRVAV